MSKKLQLLCIAVLASFLSKGQSSPPEYTKSNLSGTEVPSQQWNDWFNKEVEKFEKNLQSSKVTTINYRIPVIFHVIHFGQAVGTYPNLAYNQLMSQITVLNQDYSGTGFGVNGVPAPFANLVSNTGIQFCPATKDPTGTTLVEFGVHRINANTLGFANPSTTTSIVNYINNTIKPNPGNLWDPSKYLNIWVSDRSATQTILGFATYPSGTTLIGIPNSGGTAANDGVWVFAKTVGDIGSVVPPHDKGRVATKEIAHWLGVRNIWGDGNCLDDYCNDTPWAKQPNTGCPPFPSFINRCGLGQSPDGEMTMNFMDETDDACRYMFTPRQTLRMQTAMSQGTYRNLLGTHSLCAPLVQQAANAAANFYINGIPCVGQPFTPVNNSTGWPQPTFQWSSAPTAAIYPAPSVASPAITFNAPGTYTLYMTATNTANISSYSLVVSSVTTCPATLLCLDTIRMIKNVDTLISYKSTNSSQISGCQTGFAGFLTGTNCYHDKEFAQYFPASSYSAIPLPQVNSVIVLFDSTGTKGTIATPGTQISCILYSGTAANGPNSQIAIKSDSLSRIAASPKTTSLKYVGSPTLTIVNTKIIPYKFDFASPVIITGSSSGYFVSIQTPFNSPTDSVRILGNTKTNTSLDSSSWVLLNPTNNWRTLKNKRGAKIQLAILPQMTCRPVVGINEVVTEFNSNISLMPNPSSGQFNLLFTLPSAHTVNLNIYDARGQKISSERIENVTHNMMNIDLGNRPDGIYFVEISSGSERVVKKIVISH